MRHSVRPLSLLGPKQMHFQAASACTSPSWGRGSACYACTGSTSTSHSTVCIMCNSQHKYCIVNIIVNCELNKLTNYQSFQTIYFTIFTIRVKQIYHIFRYHIHVWLWLYPLISFLKSMVMLSGEAKSKCTKVLSVSLRLYCKLKYSSCSCDPEEF